MRSPEHNSVNGKSLVITYEGGALPFVLRSGDEVLKSGTSAQKLSKWAFENGAELVRHQYDLRLAE